MIAAFVVYGSCIPLCLGLVTFFSSRIHSLLALQRDVMSSSTLRLHAAFVRSIRLQTYFSLAGLIAPSFLLSSHITMSRSEDLSDSFFFVRMTWFLD